MRRLIEAVEPFRGVRPSGEEELTFRGATADGWQLVVIGVVNEAGELVVIHVQPVFREESK